MSDQLPLAPRTPSRSPSHEAGERVARSGVAAELEWRVLDFIARASTDGATRREIADGTGIHENTVAFRLTRLRRDCLIEQSGEKEYRGHRAARLIATPQGRRERDAAPHQGRAP